MYLTYEITHNAGIMMLRRCTSAQVHGLLSLRRRFCIYIIARVEMANLMGTMKRPSIFCYLDSPNEIPSRSFLYLSYIHCFHLLPPPPSILQIKGIEKRIISFHGEEIKFVFSLFLSYIGGRQFRRRSMTHFFAIKKSILRLSKNESLCVKARSNFFNLD